MTLEDRVSNLETNVGAIAGALEQVTQALRGISAKQDEHSRMLADHSAAFQAIMTIQSEQTQLLIEHSRMLGEHSEALQAIIVVQNEHSEALRAATGILNEHTRILLEHSVDIQFIKDLLDTSSDQEDAP